MEKIESILALIAWLFALYCFWKSGSAYGDKDYSRATFRLTFGCYTMIILNLHYH